MTLNSIIKSPKILTWLEKQIGYYSDGLFLVDSGRLVQSGDSPKLPKIIIVAKCHYTEAWQTIPSVNRSELDKILTNKQQSHSQLVTKFQVIQNNKVDGYDVRSLTLDEALVNQMGEDRLFIPETDILVPSENNALLEIETSKGKLFCANLNGVVKSSYAQGIVANIETYKLTVGLPSETTGILVSNSEFLPYLLKSLFSCSFSKLSAVTILDVKKWFNWSQLHLLYWAPLLTALCFYISTSGYYFIKNNAIESKLEQGGSEVNEILKQKRALDQNQAQITSLSSEFGEQNFVHNHWQIIDKLIEEGMSVTRMTFKEGKLTIRGTADKASDILAALSEHPIVSSAAFQGAVRKSRGRDSFVLNIEVKEG